MIFLDDIDHCKIDLFGVQRLGQLANELLFVVLKLFVDDLYDHFFCYIHFFPSWFLFYKI